MPTLQQHIEYILTAGAEPAVEHARNLLQLIILAQLRNDELPEPDPVLAELLTAMEARCWRCMWALHPYPMNGDHP